MTEIPLKELLVMRLLFCSRNQPLEETLFTCEGLLAGVGRAPSSTSLGVCSSLIGAKSGPSLSGSSCLASTRSAACRPYSWGIQGDRSMHKCVQQNGFVVMETLRSVFTQNVFG